MKRCIGTPLYRPFDVMQVRAPLLPVEFYDALGNAPAGEQLDDPRLRAAIAVASNSLTARLEDASVSESARRSAEAKLLRYLIRASARPTPFGLFSGVALGQCASTTGLRLAGSAQRIRARPDMDWLLRLVLHLEGQPAIRKALRLYVNPAAYSRSGRVYLAERVSHGEGVAEPRVSLRATNAVNSILAFANAPRPYNEIVAHLTAGRDPSARARIEALVDELLDQTLLLSELRPPLTTDNPVGHVIARLEPVAAAAEIRAGLIAFDDACRSWTKLEAGDCRAQVARLHAIAAAASPLPSDTPIQVDMSWFLSDVTITRTVGEEAARALELLLRLAPSSRSFGPLEAYRANFVNRYGAEREVPLLELLDPESGLGPPPAYSGEASWAGSGGAGNMARRNQILFALACETLRDRTPVRSLDDQTLSEMEMWPPDEKTAAPSHDIYTFVIAQSRAAIDAGDFKVAIGPNIGAGAAGRNLARFADLLGAEATAALRRMASTSAAADPDAIRAEIIYPPRKFRSANVAIRPPIQRHEIALGAAPGVAAEDTLSPADLVVGIADGRFYLRSLSRGARVLVTSTHMLNFLYAPVLCRFLADVSNDGRPMLQMFDWGSASAFPFLPRLEAGRVILVPAQWRIDAALAGKHLQAKSPASFAERLAAWRRAWNVPRHVYLSAGDHRLLFDLEKAVFAEALWSDVRKLKPGSPPLTLQEALPGPEHAWLEGPGGHYICELAVSLYRRDLDGAASHTRRIAPPRNAHAVSPAERMRSPGSDWLYMKLYGGRESEDDLISAALPAFLATLPRRDANLPFFFLRYSDPDPHLRLRFKGDARRLWRKVLPRLCEWGTSLVAADQRRSFAFDTYEREIERYGGPEAIDVVEQIFAIDSRVVLDLLAKDATPADQRVLPAVASLARLLRGLGVEERARDWWRERYAGFRRETSDEYRRRNKDLQDALDVARPPSPAPLALYDRHLPALGARLRALEAREALSCPMQNIVESLMHMHCNRFLGTDRNLERRAFGLLSRGYEARWARARAQAGSSENPSAG